MGVALGMGGVKSLPPPRKGHGTRHWVPHRKDMGQVDGSIIATEMGYLPLNRQTPVKTVPSSFLRDASGNEEKCQTFRRRNVLR